MILRGAPPSLKLFLLLWAVVVSVHADEAPKKKRDGPVARGAAVFGKYCVLCHGANAEGDGIAARNLDPRPANLRRSTLSVAQKEAIIRDGGNGVGRSSSMPPWRQELNDRQIADLLAYLASLKRAAK